MPEKAKQSMEQVILSDGRYPPEAYGFLHEALNRAVGKAQGTKPSEGLRRHVTGQELCLSLRDLAIERWGMLARTVLGKWNVQKTIDFGNMVYLLIDHDFMKKTDEDSLEDFRDVFDFDKAFRSKGEFELKE